MADESVSYEPNARGFSFRCESCGAQMRFDPKSGQLFCDSCGATRAAPQANAVGAVAIDQGHVREIPLDLGLIHARSHGLGTETVSARCDECGAVVQFTPGTTATRCAFCDSPKVLEQKSQSTSLTPESLVPFHIADADARAAFTKWLKKLWFRPNDLTRASKIREVRGVYVPYWTFDADAHSDWRAEAGYYYYVDEVRTRVVNGQTQTYTERVRHTRWEPAWGARDDKFDDVLICASKGLPADILRKMADFKTTSLVPYAPSYLAGFSAEAYAIDLNEGWGLGQKQMYDEQARRCQRDVPGDTQRFFQCQTLLSNPTFKHVLLPIWVAAFRYNDKVYRFLVNGQTGAISGKAPFSTIKIVLFILAILALIGLLATVGNS